MAGGFAALARSPSTQNGDAPKGDVVPPSCSNAPKPPYTKEARDAKFEGDVIVEVIIMTDGRVTNIRIIKSPGLGLDHSIVETLRTWKCTPGKHNGQIVPMQVPIEIHFRLNPQR